MILIVIFIITLIYLFLIGRLIYGFDKVIDFKLEDSVPVTKFSIIIPFRNEAKHLPQLLETIKTLNYPQSMFEVILVNDHSTDDSEAKINTNLERLKAFDISVISNERKTNSPKKDAITTAVAIAKYDWIVTTDADCKLPKFWLDTFDNYLQKHSANVLVAPVTYDVASSFFERFQLLDILSLQGATVGGFGINKPFLCNGANLAYRKSTFIEINGFEGNTDIASGDDIFLLEKAVKHNKNLVHYIKNDLVIVTTKALSNFKLLKAQRVRWASKTSSYQNAFGKFTGFIVLLMNALLLCLPILYATQIIALKILIYTFVIKVLVDFLLLFKTARFFNQEQYLASYLFSCILYPIFSVYIAFNSVFFGYKWKDRAYKK